MNLSVIVPVLNEADLIRGFISHLRDRLPAAEIVIVDGGSSDDTLLELEAMQAKLNFEIRSAAPGRARQMNAGARAASGEILLFLHVDSRLPEGCAQQMERLLQDPGYAGGCFRLRFPRPARIFRVSDSLGNFAVDLFRIALGDHGIFCRAGAFQACHGYPDIPLMEDADFYRALRRAGRVRQLPAAIETSPRRYEACGPFRTTFFYLFILLGYLAGLDKRRLARWHTRFTQPRAVLARRLAFSSKKSKPLLSLGGSAPGRPALR